MKPRPVGRGFLHGRDQGGALRPNSLRWVGGVWGTREHRAAPITRNPALIWLVTTHPDNP